MAVFAQNEIDPKSPALRQSTPFSKYTRLIGHVDDFTVATSLESYLQLYEVDGISFHTVDIDSLQKAMDSWAFFIHSASQPGRTLYTWLLREECQPVVPTDGFITDFAKSLAAGYQQKLDSKKLFSNRHFVGIEEKAKMPDSGVLQSILKRFDPETLLSRKAQAKENLTQLGEQLQNVLSAYDIEPLSLYDTGHTTFSMALEFVNFLVSGAWRPAPVTPSRMDNSVGLGRLFSSGDIQESQVDGKSIYSVCLGVREYRSGNTFPGLLNGFLEAPFPCVVGSSFSYIPDNIAISALNLQRSRMQNTAKDSGLLESQLTDAIRSITARQITYGELNLVVQVKGNSIAELERNVSQAIQIAANVGLVMERENPTSLAAHFSLVPGNLRLRTRPAMVSNFNYAGMTSFHNIPPGKASRNRWGSCLFPVATSTSTVHHFNLHVGQLGNFFIAGKAGEGKTALQNFLLAMTERTQTKWFVADYKRGAEMTVKALHGQYVVLSPDKSTGWNPFDREDSPSSRAFLKALCRFLVERSGPLTPRQEEILSTAVEHVMDNDDIDLRGLNALHDLLPDTNDENGIYARLKAWVKGGEYAWCFKGAGRGYNFFQSRIMGVDMTAILARPVETQALAIEMWGRFSDLMVQPGRKGFMGDELHKVLESPYFQAKLKDLEKLGRSFDSVVGGATQEVEDAVDSPVGRSVISQTSTKILFAMDNVKESTMGENGFGLTKREMEVLRDIPLQSRQFLLLQGRSGVVCQFDIGGLPHLKVLSNGPPELELFERIVLRPQCDHPEAWLPIFYEESSRNTQ